MVRKLVKVGALVGLGAWLHEPIIGFATSFKNSFEETYKEKTSER